MGVALASALQIAASYIHTYIHTYKSRNQVARGDLYTTTRDSADKLYHDHRVISSLRAHIADKPSRHHWRR
jgi:hypothetical protein